MTPDGLKVMIFLFAACFASNAIGQDRQPDLRPPDTGSATPALTGKERTGRKWMDEQRIDNCNVPADKRGSKPRPADCLHAPSG
ncbi:MAG: hypothetical protein ABW175_17115 [Bradyrhizobium sp.]